ncbi:hypothetical protein ACBY01_04610 [Sphingomonas sp. ac-8]|uniref:hypothetical protein n=1 Tax=Sphingomonas sp. ac-8 TaxID=3242977 RepID=UPI003A8034D4
MRLFSAVLVVAVASWAAAELWIEAYGSGAPYFGRMTNMDKWTDSWPEICLLGGGATLVAWGIAPRRRTAARGGRKAR